MELAKNIVENSNRKYPLSFGEVEHFIYSFSYCLLEGYISC